MLADSFTTTGTWVPMERGIALSRQYGVDRLLQPIYDYIPTAESPPLAPKHITAPASRPRKKAGDDPDSAPQPKVSRVAANKAANAAAAKVARAEAKAAKLAAKEELEMREMESDEDVPVLRQRNGSMSPTPSVGSSSGGTSMLGSEVGNNNDDEYQQKGNSYAGPSSVNKKRKVQEMGGQQQYHSQEPIQHPSSTSNAGMGEIDFDNATAHAQLNYGPLRYARMILDYFVSESTQVPSFLLTPPADFDANVVIDDDGHTALHWACAMGRIRIVKLLLSAGADIFRANSMGQTALMRSVMFTNNYDLRKFPELFELLHRSTINIDRNDRTVFHYVVDIALQKGKTHAARYYVETILGRLIDYPKEVADILNFQDEEGETALTLAARARSKRLVKILLDNGSDPKIANRDGKTAEDYILEDERFRETEVVPNGGGNYVNLGNGPLSAAIDGGGAGQQQQQQQDVLQFIPRLHSSESGQRATNESLPQIAGFIESLAQSFDEELATKEEDLAQAHLLLGSIQAEILESQRTVNSLKVKASAFEALASREGALREELESKMGKRFRLGWEKWVRDEDSREQAYAASSSTGEKDLDRLISLSTNPPLDAETRSATLRTSVERYTSLRAESFREFVETRALSGTGGKMEQYRRLVGMGCGVPMEAVDGVIENLVETLENQNERYP